MAIKKKQQTNTLNALREKRLKYFIQMLDIKQDTSMTRIYTAINQSTFLNPSQKR